MYSKCPVLLQKQEYETELLELTAKKQQTSLN
jgi:hypothetical protein